MKPVAAAREDLGLERIYVIYPGPRDCELEPGFRVLPLAQVFDPLAGP